MDLVLAWRHWVAATIQAKLRRSEQGASLIEYALLVALIAIVCIVAITVLGGNVSQHFSTDASMLS
jgi:pilus assembly protein Flp/PilA